MITKEQCIPGTKCIVNQKKTRWNEDIGTIQNGLVCHIFERDGVTIGNEKELIPGSFIEIIAPPRRIGESGVQVRFKIEGSDTIMAAWWICFKPKVDIINSSQLNKIDETKS
jgi:hypothetical protein